MRNNPRLPRLQVWCVNFMRCGGVGVLGADGGGEPELCYECEQQRLASLARASGDAVLAVEVTREPAQTQ